MRSAIRFLPVAILIVALVALLGATSAAAHVRVVKTTPGEGKSVKADKARNAVVLFSGPVHSGTVEVFVLKRNGENGRKVSKGDGARDPRNARRIRTSLADGLKTGRYVVHWTITAGDGDTQEGSFTFRAEAPEEPAATAGGGQTDAGEEPAEAQTETETAEEPAESETETAEEPREEEVALAEVPAADSSSGGGTSWVVPGIVVFACLAGLTALVLARRRRSPPGPGSA